MAQAVEQLSSKQDALNSNPSTTNKQKDPRHLPSPFCHEDTERRLLPVSQVIAIYGPQQTPHLLAP
jgi:hypothetical protein